MAWVSSFLTRRWRYGQVGLTLHGAATLPEHVGSVTRPNISQFFSAELMLSCCSRNGPRSIYHWSMYLPVTGSLKTGAGFLASFRYLAWLSAAETFIPSIWRPQMGVSRKGS